MLRQVGSILARSAIDRPWTCLICIFALCAALATGLQQFRLDPDPQNMLSPDDPSVASFRQLVDVFGGSDTLFIALEHDGELNREELTALREQINTWATELETWEWHNPQLDQTEKVFHGILGRHDKNLANDQRERIAAHSYVMLDEKRLERMARRLKPEFIEKRFQTGAPSNVPNELANRDLLGLWSSFYLPEIISEQKDNQAGLRLEEGYLSTSDRSAHTLILQAAWSIRNMEFTQHVATRLLEWQNNQSNTLKKLNCRMEIIGGYMITLEDYKLIRGSALTTGLVSLLGVIALFGFAYRSPRLIIFMVLTLVPALMAAVGLTSYLNDGKASMLMSSFAAILLGLGVDYIIHLNHAFGIALGDLPDDLSEKTKRVRRSAAAWRAVQLLGPSIILGCLTSIGAFCILFLSEFPGLRDLGLLASIGLTLILFLVLTVFPALLTIAGSTVPKQSRGLRSYAAGICRSRKPALIIHGLLIVIAITFIVQGGPLLRIDHDLRNLRPDSVASQHHVEMGRRFGLSLSGYYMHLEAPNEQQALQALYDFQIAKDELKSPIHFTSTNILTLKAGEEFIKEFQLPSELDVNKLNGRKMLTTPVGNFLIEQRNGHMLSDLSIENGAIDKDISLPAGTAMSLTPILSPQSQQFHLAASPAQQIKNLQTLKAQVDWQNISASLDQADKKTQEQYAPFIRDIRNMQTRVENEEFLRVSELNGTSIGRITQQYIREHAGTWHVRMPLTLEQNRRVFSPPDLLAALPYDFNDRARYKSDDFTITICGPTIISYYVQDAVIKDFQWFAISAFILTAVLVALHLRNLRATILALSCLSFSMGILLFVTSSLHLHWNLVNIIVIPLIIGIGVDNIIHFLHYVRHGRSSRDGVRHCIVTLGPPIIMTALTSMVGFGSLVLNAYRGIQSIGIFACIGIAAVLFVALFTLPMLCLGKRDETRMTEETQQDQHG